MFEDKTFEAILQDMLDRLPNDLDKRENSLMWNALAPAAAEQAKYYIWLDRVLQLVFADTSEGEYLRRRTAEFGVNHRAATTSKRKGLFYDEDGLPFDIPLGSRFFINDRYFVATNRLDLGQYTLECETLGTTGNEPFGELLSLDHIQGLARAELSDVLVPGMNEEDDAALFERFSQAINEQPFGGNRADYKKEIISIDGVGGMKLSRTPDGGGTVGVVIINAAYDVPSAELLDDVQTVVDPIPNQGEGLGLAPIGHRVLISGVKAVTVEIETTLTLSSDRTIGQVQADVEQAIDDYFADLRKSWEKEEFLVVRVSQIESKILTVSGVQDISNTTLNGGTSNIELSAVQIPERGLVTLHE